MPEIDVKLQNPLELSREDWIECQNIALDAYRATLLTPDGAQISENALRFMNSIEDPERYARSHRDPNTEVGKLFGEDQDFKNMHVARTYVNGVIAGFGYSADNVSGGSELVRNVKRRFPMKNYFWVRELLVLPEFLREGVATETAKSLLGSATSPQQTVTHYDWPELQPNYVNDKITQLGFETEPMKKVELFGPGTTEVMQVRRSGLTVEKLLASLAVQS